MPESILKHISNTYSPLSEATIHNWKQCAQLKQFKKGFRLVREGQYSDKLWYVVEGSLKAYYNKDGKNITDWFVFEGDFVCAIASYFQDVPSPHYMELLEDTNLLETNRDDVLNLCDKHHDFERLARIGITKTMLELQQRIVSLQFESAQQRYFNLLEKHPHIEMKVPLGEIASFLGITQETLSRIRARI